MRTALAARVAADVAEASKAQNNMAAVSADGNTVCVLIRLGADVVRYSFIVVDLHHLLLAGLPAHLCENSKPEAGRE